MGWDSTSLLSNTTIRLLLNPTRYQLEQLMQKSNDISCFFSGIRADRDVFEWFKLTLAFHVKRYIITEPPFTYRKPLWMHYIRFFMQDYKYVKYIDGVFGIGEDAVRYYKSISRNWKVLPFQYVTGHRERSKDVPKGNLKLLFVGYLSKRKNVCIVIDALKGMKHVDFTIVGDGEERINLEKRAGINGVSISFLGNRNMNEIPSIMQEFDVLVLPSRHDGWGAVVNEAMDLGLYIIISDKCGAKSMIDKGVNGDIFVSNNISSLRKCLNHVLNEKELIRKGTNERISAFDKFRAENVSRYFINSILGHD